MFDGNRYRAYRNVRDFVNGELTDKNRGKWFYAHAGGLADFQFVLEHLENTPYEVSAHFSNSSAIIVTVRRGKNCWHFLDSFWTLRDKLENIGEWIGQAKGAKEERKTEAEAKEFYRTADLYDLAVYNKTDCEILWRALGELEDVLWDLGGQLQMTLASSAMNLFRRRFLSNNISTSKSVNEIGEKAYFASRVEVINHECHDANYVDINSSFPFAMTQPCPGEFLGTSRKLPDEGLYIAKVRVFVPEVFLPPLPVRLKGRLFFPTGEWVGWFSNIDLELLRNEGGKILKVFEVLHFAPFDDLSAYAKTLYELRRTAKTPFEKTAYKLLLNSLYGKFAESEFKTGLKYNPERINRDEWEQLFPGAWLVNSQVPIPHRHVPISTHITAIGRRTLFEYMTACNDLHYCDTDGFSTDSLPQTGDALGALKLEKRIRKGTFVASKMYLLDGEELTPQGWCELGDKGAKAKGFPRMTVGKMMDLMEGKAIEFERMRRIRELARNGGFKPREDKIQKRLNMTSITKRMAYPDGHTRAWHTSELLQHLNEGRV